MSPRPPASIDPTTKRLRRIPWGRWLLYAGGAFVVLSGAVYLWLRSYSTITVAADTTYLTAPLAADGYPDYIAYLNGLNSEGITPENNAWIPLLSGFESGELDDNDRARHSKALGIPLQVLHPGVFQPFGTTQHRKQASPELLIASSAAAQWPWHVRFVRLLALNADKRANQCLFEENNTLPKSCRVGFSLYVTVSLAAELAANRAIVASENDTDSEAARMYRDFDALDEVSEFVVDEEPYPDLSETALKRKIQAQHSLPTAWMRPEVFAKEQKAQYDLARDTLFGREETIMTERPWSRAECPLAAAWLDTQSAALDRLIAEMAARPKFYVPYLTATGKPDDEIAYAILLPNLQMMRLLSQALQQRAYHALQRGDLAAAIRDFESQLGLASLHPANPMLIDTLIALSLQNSALQTLAEILADPRVTEEQFAQLAKQLEQSQPLPSYLLSMEAERIATLDFIVAFAARDKKSKVIPHIDMQVITFVAICWDDVLRWFNALYDRAAIAIKNKDWLAMQQLGLEAETCPPELVRWSVLPSKRTEIAKHVFARILVSGSFSAYHRLLVGEVRHDAARVLLALERFRRANKSYPASLAELVPTYLPAIPNDPFAGQPLKYFRTVAGGYRAYSVGYNGIDDGGIIALDKDGDVDGQTGDLVIGSPDEIPPKLNLAW